jgi:hypothetical protein
MTWELRLIATYYVVCEYRSQLSFYTIRHTNNDSPIFTDEEVMTIYLFCTTDTLKLHSNKQIHSYANRHLRSWFPHLPKYEAFNARLNNLSESFRCLTELVTPRLYEEKREFQAPIREFITDSLPVMLATRQRSARAKVALEIANVGYCATKKIAYHGLKFHAANLMSEQAALPKLFCSAFSPASAHDNTIFKEHMAQHCINSKVYSDSAYCDQAAAPELLELFNVTVCPIQKRKPYQVELFFDQICQNRAISRIRQPIEGYFNWLIELTNFQNASKCRSTKGVLTHIYGKLAASVVFLLILNF